MTTIFFPDVSHYQAGDRIQPGTAVVVAKATQSTTLFDSAYRSFKAQAGQVGAFFMAYHWLNHGNIANQAAWAHGFVGDTPLMLDIEDVTGNTGYNGNVTVGDIEEFVTRYRALGGIVHVIYLPRWYWSGHMGSPDLTPLVNLGLHLVASEYRAYSDTSWPSAYGHMNPEEWQFTDHAPYGGGFVDMNAFKGTAQDFQRLATGQGEVPDMTSEQDRLLRNAEYLLSILLFSEPYDPHRLDWGQGPGVNVPKALNTEGPTTAHIDQVLGTLVTSLQGLSVIVQRLADSQGGLTDQDRAIITALTDAVNTLESRLASP